MTIPEIFKLAVEKKASDVHLVADKPPIFRIDGTLIPTELPITDAKTLEELIMSMLTPHQQEIYRTTRDLDISYSLEALSRFRINLHWEKNNPGMVARLIPNQIPTFADLQLPDIAAELTRLKDGLVLVTGPTGCGKSSTLAAMIELINNERACHIMTLEDPIEFVYMPKQSVIKQRQLGTDILSFGEGLKHVLRQDPNVILVGEMRDLETIAAAITLAETGHLVFGTLHTNTAASTIERIVDVFPPYQQTQIRLQLANSFRSVLAQRLLPKKGGGRIAAREFMIANAAVSNLIRENKPEQINSVIQTSRDVGMFSMDQDIKRLFEAGLIEEDIARAYMRTPEYLSSAPS